MTFEAAPSHAAAIERDLGEVKGDIKGLIALLARVTTQLDEQRAVNEAAHARQDARILELTRSQAAIEGSHAAAIRWTGLVGSLVGALIATAAAFLMTHQ